VGFVLLAGLGVLGGESVYRLWRRAERNARKSARQARLLINVAAQLQRVKGVADVYQLLPALAAEVFRLEHAAVLVPVADKEGLEVVSSHNWQVPAGFRVPLKSVVGRALRQGELIYVPDAQRDPDFIVAPFAAQTRSELAIPLRVAGQITAVLNLEHRDRAGFDQSDIKSFAALGQIAESALWQAQMTAALEQQLQERGFIAHLQHKLVVAQDRKSVAQSVVAELVARLGVEMAGVFALQAGRLVPLALGGDVGAGLQAELAPGLPWQTGALYDCWRSRQPLYVEDARELPGSDPFCRAFELTYLALLPVTDSGGEVLAVLALAGTGAPRPWPERERTLLRDVTDIFGLALERGTIGEQLWELLAVTRQLAQAEDPRQLYEAAVEAAVRLIPGAEAASLLVRGPGGFRFEAAVGFDLGPLQSVVVLPLQAQRHWYGEAEEAFERGVPRVLKGEAIVKRSAASIPDARSSAVIREAGKVAALRCNLCVPIVHRREVLGMLNLDSFSHEEAFGSAALTLAEAYGQQVAVIIRQVQYREALERLAVSDPLTGLGNRAAFNRDFQRELAAAKRFETPLSLVLVDLDGFKQVNDRFGHPYGDEVLKAVALSLRASVREIDRLYRWGGDEFALILPQTDASGAAAAVARYAAAIAKTPLVNGALRASIGVATYPDDADDEAALLQQADLRLYREKGQRGP
jgi:diguanylate cyclase (GGDEF)-like protein